MVLLLANQRGDIFGGKDAPLPLVLYHEMGFLRGNPTDYCWAQDKGMDKDLHPVAGEFACGHGNTLDAGLTGSGGHRPSREIDHEKIPSGGAVVGEESEEYKKGAFKSQSSALGNIQS